MAAISSSILSPGDLQPATGLPRISSSCSARNSVPLSFTHFLCLDAQCDSILLFRAQTYRTSLKACVRRGAIQPILLARAWLQFPSRVFCLSHVLRSIIPLYIPKGQRRPNKYPPKLPVSLHHYGLCLHVRLCSPRSRMQQQVQLLENKAEWGARPSHHCDPLPPVPSALASIAWIRFERSVSPCPSQIPIQTHSRTAPPALEPAQLH